jgi:hypothetical protein
MKVSEYVRSPIPTRSGPKAAGFFVIPPQKFGSASKPLGGLLAWKMQEAVPGTGARQLQSRILHPKGHERTSEQRKCTFRWKKTSRYFRYYLSNISKQHKLTLLPNRSAGLRLKVTYITP